MPVGPSSRYRRAISRTQFTEERVTRATSAVDVPLLSNHKICHCVRATGSFVRRYRCSSSSRVRWAGMSNVRAIPSVYTRISYHAFTMQGERLGWGAPGRGGRGGCGGSWMTWESVAIFERTVSAASGGGVLGSEALARLLSL